MEAVFENKAIRILTFQDERLSKRQLQLDALLLHEIDPVISGNKWFKLKYYLQDAQARGFNKIGTFGGAYSNHIIAAAKACNKLSLSVKGVIRGEEPRQFSTTLQEAKELGMELHFVSRTDYKDKEKIKQSFPDHYWINEGGYGALGARGAGDILEFVKDIELYSHIVLAVGTGTTFAGIVEESLPIQEAIGISVLKNNAALETDVYALLSEEARKKKYSLLHDFHFGGYAKSCPELFDFMNKLWLKQEIPTDFVYTAKALKAVFMLNEQEKLPQGSRVLFIHTGGLQGNRSLPKGTLVF